MGIDVAMKPVAVCDNLLSRQRERFDKHGGLESCLDEHNIPWEYVDCYRSDIINILPKYSALFWHYSNFVNADLMEAQHILDLAESMGLIVYPDHHTAWHFDDKIAEMYALQAVNAQIPNSWVFYEYDKCVDWLEHTASFPLVAKLRRGSGSNNVKLLHSVSDAKRYARRMFTKGYSPAQSLAYKTYSKIQSTRDWETFAKRFKQIPNFLKARKFGKGMPAERGYCYFQEYIENAGYDLKIAVVNGKCSYFARHTRKGDFRASGGGDFYYDDTLITKDIIREVFRTADALHTQCIGFDIVVESKTGKGLIVEMCHGFDYDAVYDAKGYYDRGCVWHEEPMHCGNEIIKELLGNCLD